MKSAGYRTYLVGKWDLGFSTSAHLPTRRGFDYFYGYLNGVIDYWTKNFETHLDLHENEDLVTDADAISPTLHAAHLFQRKAEAAIASHAAGYPGTPMFLLYPTQLIHSPWDAPSSYLDRCAMPTDRYGGCYPAWMPAPCRHPGPPTPPFPPPSLRFRSLAHACQRLSATRALGGRCSKITAP